MSTEENKKKIESIEKALNMFGAKNKNKEDIKVEKPKKIIDEEKEIVISVSKVESEPEEEEEVETIKVEEKKSSVKLIPLEKLKENLKPELKEALNKISNSNNKEKVSNLVNYMSTNKESIFDKKVTNVFENLSMADEALLSKKLDEIQVPKEDSDINTAVIVAWLNKTKK